MSSTNNSPSRGGDDATKTSDNQERKHVVVKEVVYEEFNSKDAPGARAEGRLSDAFGSLAEASGGSAKESQMQHEQWQPPQAQAADLAVVHTSAPQPLDPVPPQGSDLFPQYRQRGGGNCFSGGSGTSSGQESSRNRPKPSNQAPANNANPPNLSPAEYRQQNPIPSSKPNLAAHSDRQRHQGGGRGSRQYYPSTVPSSAAQRSSNTNINASGGSGNVGDGQGGSRGGNK